MKLEKNNYECWQQAYKELANDNTNTIEVEIDSTDIESESIINLRYFFPLAMHFMQTENNTPLMLDIKLTRTEAPDDIKRLYSFFSQVSEIPDITIQVNKQKLKNTPWEASRIFPLCLVQQKPELPGCPDYTVLNDCLYDKYKRKNEENPDMKSYSYLANKLLEYVRNSNNYKGTPEYKMTRADKDALRNEVDEYMHSHLIYMPILAQIIWLYILRELIELKELYGYPEKTERQPHIHNSIMAKSRLDAISYGESMYQLIENACLHSYGRHAWFGFRMHCAGKNATMSNLLKETRTRNKLYEDYKPCFAKLDKNNHTYSDNKNIFNENYCYFFEFFVLDDASNQTGMIKTYNQYIRPDRQKAECIENLFEINIKPDPLEAYVEDITVHYGLRLLRRIISLNKGYLIGKTPDGKEKTQYYFNGNSAEMKNESDDSFVTEWTAILPVSYKWPELTAGSDAISGKTCFGTTIEQPRKQLYYFDDANLFSGITQSPKAENIKLLLENLRRCMSELNNKKKDLEDSVILLQTDSTSTNNIELFSKALFARIAEINPPQNPAIELRIAILFEHKDAIFEFIRFFSVFYLRNKQDCMQNVQIALCEKDELCNNIYDVTVMLVGKYLSSAYGYARLFAYHHTGKALEYLPLLDYLTMKEDVAEQGKSHEEDISLFPFDLYLPNAFERQKHQCTTSYNNWFLQRMKYTLNTSIQDKNYGCLIDDIHIRLGSKLHLRRFYEAELLFHNMGNVIRFAYIIARELLYGNQKLLVDQPVLLLGYEKYSSMLLMQVEYWLKQSCQFSKVCSAIVHDSEKEKEKEKDVKVRPYFDEWQDICNEAGSFQIVTIVPIATTLSTIYKMHNVSRIQLQKYFGNQWTKLEESRNFCLILVNSDLNNCSLSEISSRYWEDVAWETHLVTLKRQRAEESKIKVQYFIDVDAEWLDPQDCPVCRSKGKNMRPIIDVKHSDTMAGAIFSLWGPHAGNFKKLTGNEYKSKKRIGKLYGNVFYSHIYSGNNHFQFYIDFKKLYDENKKYIDEELCKNRVQQNCFHVIVSPLQLRNSTFVKAVIDNAFEGNVRFLYMNITDAYREEIRSKFSHLTQEFYRMRYTNPKAKFSFHFVDTSIITGNQLNRARLLIQMLLNQSNVNYDDVQLFEKVFLLVNRSSYDTVNHFVHEPEKNMYAYIHLAIPSYNTESDFCPACKLLAKFQLLGKRSSTERLSREFLRLQEKHKKRTSDEYHTWLEGSDPYIEMSDYEEPEGALFSSPAYLGWLKEWLYVCVSADQSKILSFVPEEAKAHEKPSDLNRIKDIKNNIDNYYISHNKARDMEDLMWGKEADEKEFQKRDDYLDRLSKTNLNDIAKYISDEKKRKDFLSSVKDIVKRHLIGVRDYMRLYAMQQSYEKLEDIQFKDTSMKNTEYREAIIELIGDAIVKEDTGEMKSYLADVADQEKKKFLLTYNVEWLISYIKVLSRAQIVNYYEYRQAIVGFMEDLLRILYRRDLYDFMKKSEEKRPKISKKWEEIVGLLQSLQENDDTLCEYQLCARLRYQVHMTLVHRLSDLQITTQVDENRILSFVKLYSEIMEHYFMAKPTRDVSYIEIPSASKNIIRYLRAAKSATMTSTDDIPCLILAEIPDKLEAELKNKHKPKTISEKRNLISTVQYIYLENTRMLYSGMLDIKKSLSANVMAEISSYRPVDSFSVYMEKLNSEVEHCLKSSYGNLDNYAIEDLLYQNLLSNFCRFWYKSTKKPPIDTTGKIGQIAYMLRYFMSLENLSGEAGRKPDNDELPYLYEELCRILCGITEFQMCYFTYCHAGNYPEIFAQSGCHVELMMQEKLLTSVRMDEIIRLAQEAENELLPGISKITKKDGCDYLVLFISLIQDMESKDGIYIVLQSDGLQAIFADDSSEFGWIALRKARDVLFLRQRLQEALSRDYSILIKYRFDCSYVRPISKDNEKHPSAMHISDLHVQQDMSSESERICKNIESALKKCSTENNPAKMDLLIISGDIVDSRDANAPRMEQNYRYAEQLLNHIVSTLWKDESGYLPHDWRRRIIVSTGNHDYASMNQYQAAQKGRTLTSALPTDGESGTMSKFAYFIEFLIHYLDAPVDQLLYNDLNEIRYYQKLNLKILLLNCSGNAVPRRTNKMGINVNKVRELLKRDVWRSDTGKLYDENGKIVRHAPFRLVVGHYSPEYELSYFLDQYDVLPGWMWEPGECKLETRPMNYLVKLFQDAAQMEMKHRFIDLNATEVNDKEKREIRERFMAEFKNLNEALRELEDSVTASPTIEVAYYYNQLKSTASNISTEKKGEKEAAKEIVHKMKENELYQQLDKYYKWLKATCGNKNNIEEWSEEVSRLLQEVGESLRMGNQDKKLFEDFIKHEVKGEPTIKDNAVSDKKDASKNDSPSDEVDTSNDGSIPAEANIRSDGSTPDKTATNNNDDKANSRTIDLYLAGHIHAYAENAQQDILVADKLFDHSRLEIHGYIIQNMIRGDSPDNPIYQGTRFGNEPVPKKCDKDK